MEVFSNWGVLSVSFVAILVAPFLFKILTRGSHKYPPGPKPWPIIGNLNLIDTNLPHQSLHKLSQIYGPIMQLKYGSVPVVIAASAEMAKQFLKTHDHMFATRPQNTAGKYSGRNHSGLLWAPHGPHWRQWRKICLSQLFTQKRLESYEYIRVEEMRAFMSSLFASSGKPIFVENKLYCLSISIIVRALLGKNYFSDFSKNDITKLATATTIQLEEFRGMLVDFLKLNGAFTVGDWIPWLKFLDMQGNIKQMKALQKKFDKFFDLVFEENKANRESFAIGTDE